MSKHVVVFLMVITTLATRGQQVLTLSPENLRQPYPVYLSAVSVYTDSSGIQPLPMVQQQKFLPFASVFSTIPDHLPIGITYWLRLSLQSEYRSDTTIVLYSDFQNHVQAWYAADQRLTPVAQCGNMIPASALSIDQYRQALYLPLLAGKVNSYFVRVQNLTTYHTEPFKPYLMSGSSLSEIQLKSLQRNRTDDFIFFTGMGMFLIMIIYLVIKWLYLKDSAYVYYALSLFGGSVFYLSSFVETGNNMFFFDEYPKWVYIWSDAFAFLGVYGYWQFVRHFLYIDRENPGLGKYMRSVALSILIYTVITQVWVMVNGNIWQYVQRNTMAGLVLLAFGLFVLVAIRKINQPLLRIIYGGILVTIVFYFIASVFEIVRDTPLEFLSELAGGAPILMLGTTLQMLYSVIGLAYRNKLESVQSATMQMAKAAAEMKALRAQMNPHFIFNCMHTIDAYIFKEQPDKASAFLNKFSKLIRQTLQNSQYALIPLHKEMELLKIYVELEEERYDQSFEVMFSIEPAIGMYKIPPLLLQPFTENAILHGLRHLKDRKGVLHIGAHTTRDTLHICIRDNGIGRLASARLNKEKKHHTPMAVELTRQRLTFYNESTVEEGYVLINDLAEKDTQGTEVLIVLPLLKGE